MTPRLEVDVSTGDAYIQLTEEPVARTVEVDHGHVNVDLDASGAAVGVELLHWCE